MVQKPEKGRYLQLEDVRVSYKAKEDTIHLTSSDSDIPNGSFFMTLKQGTPTEQALRTLLEKEGLIRSDRYNNAIKDDITPSIVMDMLMKDPEFISVTGRPGAGKTTIASKLAATAKAAKMPVVIITHRDEFKYNKLGTKIKLSELPKGHLDPFDLMPEGIERTRMIEDFLYKILIGSEDRSDKTLERKTIISSALNYAQNLGGTPDLPCIRSFLLEGASQEGRMLGFKLDRLLNSEHGHLFVPNNTRAILKDGTFEHFTLFDKKELKIIDLSSLKIDTGINGYRTENSNVAEGILNLLDISLFNDIKNDDSPKLLVQDPFWNRFSDFNATSEPIYRAFAKRNVSVVALAFYTQSYPFKTFVTQEFIFEPEHREEGLALQRGEFLWKKNSDEDPRLVAVPYTEKDKLEEKEYLDSKTTKEQEYNGYFV